MFYCLYLFVEVAVFIEPFLYFVDMFVVRLTLNGFVVVCCNVFTRRHAAAVFCSQR